MHTLRSRLVYSNAWMSVREDDVELPDGSVGLYGVVDKQDLALVLPSENGGFHLVEQFRYPVADRFWEFPQGSWPASAEVAPPADGPGPRGPERLAATELREETGLVADSLTYLGRVHVAHGYSNQGCHVFLAEGLTQWQPEREATEADMRQRWVSEDDLNLMITEGRFVDGLSLAALTLLDRTRRTRPPGP
ncbi:NUDIX hydrolase [Sphaerisporangium sp. TRM90804]|uniref:NUDIX hydrolase n=1 Tax=Sphaerisporangium sp. TRM90804 TaxID=3031113 RepID=UPI002448B4C8|nr:NUDIX hydrolase [Sphaerisporangium sp. TRM90804]MDH2427315.1 NUDIX hydrolase [Sphaerisporangium sp. TRM90804]